MSKHARRTHAVLLAVLAGGILCPSPAWPDHKPNHKPGGGGEEPPPPTDTGRIVYGQFPSSATDDQLRLFDLDQQTDDPLFTGAPRWAPAWSHISDAVAGRWIVFQNGFPAEPDSGLWRIREDGTDAARFLPHPTGEFFAFANPVLSPDDQWLAFVLHYTECCDRELALQRFDATMGTVVAGSQPIIVTDCPSAPADPATPTWAPDGTSIAFSSVVRTEAGTTWHVYRVDLTFDGDSAAAACPIVKLTETTEGGSNPDWSSATPDWPNGRIAYEKGADLAHMNPDGSDVTTLPSPRFVSWRDPSWAPDASRIAFLSPSKKKGRHTDDISIISPNGSGLVQRTDSESGTSIISPAWRPAEFVDCNLNGLNDSVDIARGTSLDVDADGVPDECP